MINVDDAVRFISQHFTQNAKFLSEEMIDLQMAEGRLLLQDLRADRQYPPFHRATMDGIAVNFEQYQLGLRRFKLNGVQAAGMPAIELSSGDECIEIMTGAVLPIGSDLVIPYEHINLQDGYAQVLVQPERVRMQNVHLMGSDCQQGEQMLASHHRLIGPHTAIAASIGAVKVVVQKQPSLLLVTTGDELVEIEDTPRDYQIRKSNALALKHSLQLAGLSKITIAHLPDDLASIRSFYMERVPAQDIVIFTGGVSKGKFDYLPQIFQEMHVEQLFHGVAQRPGKPMWFGVDKNNNTTIFGLPGNPISCLVCLHRYVLPVLNLNKQMYAKLSRDIPFKPDLAYFVPVFLQFSESGEVLAHPNLAQNSGEFAALAGTDGFIELPRGKDLYSQGESFKFFSWGRVCN